MSLIPSAPLKLARFPRSLVTTRRELHSLRAFSPLKNNAIGIANMDVRYQALTANTTGTTNAAVGYQALSSFAVLEEQEAQLV